MCMYVVRGLFIYREKEREVGELHVHGEHKGQREEEKGERRLWWGVCHVSNLLFIFLLEKGKKEERRMWWEVHA